MTWRVGDIIGIVEEIAPPELAEAWDNVGLQVGSRDWPVRRLWVALDPLPQVVDAACGASVDLLITHHPLIFKPLTSVDCTTPTGGIIWTSLEHRMSVFSAHTNLDAVTHGVNDTLARRIGLRNLQALVPEDRGDSGAASGAGLDEQAAAQGLGRIGDLPRKSTLVSLAAEVKAGLGKAGVAMAGDPDLPVEKVALCSGSGASLLDRFLASDAQVYISGDLRYHDAREVENAGKGLLDIGHFASEHLIVAVLADRLRKALTNVGAPVTVEACRLETDPFVII
ncbi:MAG: Nif3-like dinuclear metal center hexameric protein [Deltaproteobacteria bacterium]|nr:Nif3-like dinuclear metal center hexameric protein [Deltaproteobacteria bacterium]